MDYIRKIPILLGLAAALMIGMMGYSSGTPNREIILNMLIGMTVFYIIGIFIRNTIQNIIETIELKRLAQEEEAMKLEQEKKKEEDQIMREERQGGKLDLVADDPIGLGEEDFDVLPVAEFIKKELQ